MNTTDVKVVLDNEPYYNFQLITEDQDDNKFTDCAIASDAYVIVSNDKHFKVLTKINIPKVNIMTLDEFEKEFKQNVKGWQT